MHDSTPTLYERIGGERKVLELVNAFYDRVSRHPDLQPIFPDDLTETKQKQFLFLSQYLGGPPLYSQVHGHPMLRARHMKFPITPTRAKAWLSCMAAAMEEVGITGETGKEMFDRLTFTARHMINTEDEDA